MYEHPAERRDIWALILAGGASRRMGQPKLLLPAPQGSLLKQTIHQALAAGNVRVAVIAPESGPLRREHTEGLPIEWLTTALAERGLGATLAAGVRQLEEHHTPAAVMILLGDQPEISPEAIRQVTDAFTQIGAGIVQSRYDDRPAHPVLFTAELFSELMALDGDAGAKELLHLYQDHLYSVRIPGMAPQDIDTPEEYERYRLKVFPQS
ncbi:MAG: nucleotidyltransferase family protein [Paenibacillaceae bacterium]|uniref:Nucleotidyltransferase family protein n=1 Tax=Paenibacillus mellifer TaxID=2937794 RepID=A0A9X1Y256_9BACL|nr:nucleotidyltransferase family protein [Paenibacillus mellifer]MBW4841712.1 nucleotidyltransferase family protein [Paenibacillaceae bacterium]MCK8489389.1 nucleotidyltransferase family protein [Paenibacillus mellifer]